jgi:pimeloyl-ACP methyl ester carboxylesterase
MERCIDTEVGKLAVYDEGRGAPAFFWPSLYVDHTTLDGVVAELAAERRCIRIDGPGHGKSPGPSRAYDLASCARAAFRVLDTLGVDAVDWVGNAWGGHVGVCAAVASPTRVRSLVAIGSPMQALTIKLRFQTRLLLAMLRLGLDDTVGSILAKAMLSPTGGPELHAAVRACVRHAPSLALAVRSISLDRPDLVDQLPNVRCPTLFVAGADDAMWPPELASEQAALLPHGRCETLARAAHLGPLEHPHETASLVRAHWSSTPPWPSVSADRAGPGPAVESGT